MLAGVAVWKHRRCHCVLLEANGLAVYDLRHDGETLGDAVAKTDRTLRVAMEREEDIEGVMHNVLPSRCDAGRRSSRMSISRRGAASRLSGILGLSRRLIAYRTSQQVHKHLGRAFLANNTLQLAPSSLESDIRTSVLLSAAQCTML